MIADAQQPSVVPSVGTERDPKHDVEICLWPESKSNSGAHRTG